MCLIWVGGGGGFGPGQNSTIMFGPGQAGNQSSLVPMSTPMPGTSIHIQIVV